MGISWAGVGSRDPPCDGYDEKRRREHREPTGTMRMQERLRSVERLEHMSSAPMAPALRAGHWTDAGSKPAAAELS